MIHRQLADLGLQFPHPLQFRQRRRHPTRVLAREANRRKDTNRRKDLFSVEERAKIKAFMRSFLRPWNQIALTILAMILLPAQPTEVEAVGFVSQLKGKWTRDQKTLALRDEIFPDNTVRTDPSTTSAITIALFDGSMWTRVCAPRDPCDGGSLRVSVPVADRSIPAYLKNYFRVRARVPAIFTASRAIGSGGPADTVLALENGAVDVSAALKGVGQGRWRVTLSDPALGLGAVFSRTLDWPGPALLKTGVLPMAVYALDVQNEKGAPAGPPSAVLLVDAANAKSAQTEFQNALDLVARWTGIAPAIARAFLIQTLYAIQTRTQP
jgi:hypothetical protein